MITLLIQDLVVSLHHLSNVHHRRTLSPFPKRSLHPFVQSVPFAGKYMPTWDASQYHNKVSVLVAFTKQEALFMTLPKRLPL